MVEIRTSSAFRETRASKLLRWNQNDSHKLNHGNSKGIGNYSEERPKRSENDCIVNLQHRCCDPKYRKKIKHKPCDTHTLQLSQIEATKNLHQRCCPDDGNHKCNPAAPPPDASRYGLNR